MHMLMTLDDNKYKTNHHRLELFCDWSWTHAAPHARTPPVLNRAPERPSRLIVSLTRSLNPRPPQMQSAWDRPDRCSEERQDPGCRADRPGAEDTCSCARTITNIQPLTKGQNTMTSVRLPSHAPCHGRTSA